jgi:hypothetical protein
MKGSLADIIVGGNDLDFDIGRGKDAKGVSGGVEVPELLHGTKDTGFVNFGRHRVGFYERDVKKVCEISSRGSIVGLWNGLRGSDRYTE